MRQVRRQPLRPRPAVRQPRIRGGSPTACTPPAAPPWTASARPPRWTRKSTPTASAWSRSSASSRHNDMEHGARLQVQPPRHLRHPDGLQRPGQRQRQAGQPSSRPTAPTTRGTNNNCANGYTPWGTYLTCEENFTQRHRRAAGDNAKRSAKRSRGLNRYGLPRAARAPTVGHRRQRDLYARWNASVTGASAAEDYRNVFNTFGWVVEIDPFNPDLHPGQAQRPGPLQPRRRLALQGQGRRAGRHLHG
jgi:secreted PhoX family phosphatase